MYVVFPVQLLLERPQRTPSEPLGVIDDSVASKLTTQQSARPLAGTNANSSVCSQAGGGHPESAGSNPGIVESHNYKAENSLEARATSNGQRAIRKNSAMTSEKPSLLVRELMGHDCNELLKTFNTATFKLVTTVSDFTLQLSQINEQHAEQLQRLVETFRKRNSELRNERPACHSTLFQSWESLLHEVDVDSNIHMELASVCGRQVARALMERTFHRKVQSRKLLTDRDQYEALLQKQHQQLQKHYKAYCDSYLAHVSAPSSITLSNYFNRHNLYVQQLRSSNAMISEYESTVLPTLLQELEQVHGEVTYVIADGILQATDLMAKKTSDQSRRYEALSDLCKAASGKTDLHSVVKLAAAQPPAESTSDLASAGATGGHEGCPSVSTFTSPANALDNRLSATSDGAGMTTQLKDDIVVDPLSSVSFPGDATTIRRQCTDLESQLKQLKDAVETKVRLQNRSLESSLFNKCNDLQEEISNHQYELLLARLHLAAATAQRDLLVSNAETPGGDKSRERRPSGGDRNSMKTKWLKAFRSLKTSGIAKDGSSDRRNGREGDREGSAGATSGGALPEGTHWFQEYTYKKITACDACNQILRGHTRQGLKCRLCRMNVHSGCQSSVPRCQPRSRLLRRQKSTSELESRRIDPADDTVSHRSDSNDPVYNLLKQAAAKRKEPSLTASVIQEHTAEATGGGSGRGGREELSKQDGQIPRSTVGDHRAPPTPSSSQAARRQLPMSRGLNPPPTLQRGVSSSSDCTTRSSLESCVVPPSIATAASRQPSVNSKSSSKDLFRRWSVKRWSKKDKDTEVDLQIFVSDVPHSPRRHRLQLRMKSFSLDSPEYVETLPSSTGPTSRTHSSHPSSYSQSPASPVHNRRLLQSVSRGAARISSLDLPDENDRSQSSASVSPCPSPQKHHRMLPATIYVVLFNFKSRQEDELDLTAGNKLTVIDSTNPDWWKGKCMGKVGFFPSNYVTKLMGGERPLQVTHNLQLSDSPDSLKLLRDQIVIQTADQKDGMVRIRDGENRSGMCPLKYLIEV